MDYQLEILFLIEMFPSVHTLLLYTKYLSFLYYSWRRNLIQEAQLFIFMSLVLGLFIAASGNKRLLVTSSLFLCILFLRLAAINSIDVLNDFFFNCPSGNTQKDYYDIFIWLMNQRYLTSQSNIAITIHMSQVSSPASILLETIQPVI